jgi:perosamine synthetase
MIYKAAGIKKGIAVTQVASSPTFPRSARRDEKQKLLAMNGAKPVSEKAVPFMSTALTAEDKAAVMKVLDSGMLRAASQCAAFEARWAEMTGCGHAMTCANGTVALQLAYEPLIQPGDEVLVPAWSYIATVSMVVARGAIPIFVDALPDTMQIDMVDAARKVTRKTTAIAATHLYGCPVDIDAVEALAGKANLAVVYDSAQGHLAKYKGQPMGAFGDAVTYSMYATKNLATGEGGIITCNEDSLARDIQLLRSHGETEKYLHEHIGYNYRMNDMAGAIGLSRLDRLPQQTAQRRINAGKYDKILAGIDGLIAPSITAGAEAVYHLYVMQLAPGKFACTRDDFANALKAEGVPTAVHYPRSLPNQPALAEFSNDDTPVADGLASRVLALPMHHDLTDDHIRVVGEALNKVAEAYRL